MTEVTCRVCGVSEPDIPTHGPYTRLCRTHRSERAKEMAAGRSRGRDARVDATRRPKFVEVVRELVPLAEKLEVAVEERRLSGVRARTVLSEFNAHLKLIGRVGQSLLNTSKAEPRTEET